MKKINFIYSLLIVLLNTSANAGETCMAVRGNGEAVPAHWGTMAHAIEIYGTPQKLAGGSSGAISVFLLQSILINSEISSLTEKEKSIDAAYLMKSIEGFSENLFDEKEWRNLRSFLKIFVAPESEESKSEKQKTLPLVMKWFFSKNPFPFPQKIKLLKDAIQELIDSQLLNGPGVQNLSTSIKNFELTHAKRDLEEIKLNFSLLKKSLSVLGSFDAKNDPALLVRDGLVNFHALGILFGKMGNFYALRDASIETKKEFSNHLQRCAPSALGKTWKAFESENPQCITDFRSLLKLYYKKTKLSHPRIEDEIGNKTIPAIASTAILGGQDAEHLKKLKSNFLLNADTNALENLGIQEKNIKFGYWGSNKDLSLAQSVLFDVNHPYSEINKSTRFKALGNTTWETVLSLSPAEPGLSSFLDLDSNWISLGGWSDLHPSLVLKASGCKEVVYITRKGGDTIFGQGVAKRLFNFSNISWDQLDKTNPMTFENNKAGNEKDQNSLWSKIYNLANPKSSFAYSLSETDVVFCTDWDKYDVKKDFITMINEGYTAPIYERSQVSKLNLSSANYIDRTKITDKKEFAGCVPFKDL